MIWMVYRTDRIGYDEYDAHIVVADTKEEATEILNKEFSYLGSTPNWWVDGSPKDVEVHFENLSERKEKDVIMSSFNAG